MTAGILDDPGVQKWLGRLSAADRAKFVDGLPACVWGLDALIE